MTTAKKNPPMAKASREFLAGMQLPPSNHTDLNIKIAALFSTMLLHCSGLESGAETVTCSPSRQQIADLLHCSIKAVSRLLQAAQLLGLLDSQKRGDGLSCVYTLRKTPQPGQLVSRLKSSSRDTSTVQPGHLDGSAGTLPISAGTNSDLLRSKASGSSQEKTTQGIGSAGSDSSFSQTKGPVPTPTPTTRPLTALEMARERQRRAAEAL